jgi:N-methylhydantoinase A/oxoprolinase/acetone carboxylase beta subunit
MSWRVGIDIGGTFTGLVALADDGRLTRHKVSQQSRPGDSMTHQTALRRVPFRCRKVGLVN